MRGIFLTAGRAPEYRTDLPAPRPSADETLVRVSRAGVCATDLALARGYMGFEGVPGHEFVGIAETGRFAGRRVVGEINAACGRCERCRRGSSRHCATRSVLGILGRTGAFAEYLCLPDANLHLVPNEVSDDAATFAEPLAAAFEIPSQIELRGGTRAVVAGDGRLGLLCAHVLHRHGCEVTVLGRHAERQALLPAGVRSIAEGLERQTIERHGLRASFELAVEATGRPESLALLLATVEPRGTVVLKTTTERPSSIDLAPLVVDEITLVGSRCGPFGPALAALADGSVPVERFVAATYGLRDAARAFAHAATSGTLKVLFDPSRAG